MSAAGLHVLRPGPLATLQGPARRGLRHHGVAQGGPADPLSFALAARLVGNSPGEAGLEITAGGALLEFTGPAAFAFTGAEAEVALAGQAAPAHQTLFARPGDRLEIGAVKAGFRVYLAVAGGFEASAAFGSGATMLAAGLGGFEGRALRAGDRPAFRAGPEAGAPRPPAQTPLALRPAMAPSSALRAVPGPDYTGDEEGLWWEVFTASARMDRTGIALEGRWPSMRGAGLRPSAAIFPGAVQLTPSGEAFLLLPDSQTTGGYPHMLQVIRADRHLLGQIRPGARVRFLRRSAHEAAELLRAKTALFADWLPGFRF